MFRSILLAICSILMLSVINGAESKFCNRGCDLALASYTFSRSSNLSYVADLMNTTPQSILLYNPQIPNVDYVVTGDRANVPFKCDCIDDGDFLGHVFEYNARSGDTYEAVAAGAFANLTTPQWLRRFNEWERVPGDGGRLNVVVNCSCGDSRVSREYGLFVTYPLARGEAAEAVARGAGVGVDLVKRYNAGVDFGRGSGIVFVPGKGRTDIPLDAPHARILRRVNSARRSRV